MRYFLSLILAIFIGCKGKEESAKPTIKIGAIVSLTGPASEQGRNWLSGVNFAIHKLNQENINVDLIVEDDGTTAASSASAFTKLATVDKVDAVIGGTWDYLAEAAIPLAERHKVPFITPSNPPEILSSFSFPAIFSSGLSLEAESKAIEHFLDEMSPSTVLIAYPNLPFGTSHAELVRDALNARHIKHFEDFVFTEDGSRQDTAAVLSLRILKEKPNLVYAVLDYDLIDLLTRKFKAMDFYPLFLTTQHLEKAYQFSKDPARYKNTYAVHPTVDPSFNESFKVWSGKSPQVFAAHGFDAAMFLTRAISSGVDLKSSDAQFSYNGATGKLSLPAVGARLLSDNAEIVSAKDLDLTN